MAMEEFVGHSRYRFLDKDPLHLRMGEIEWDLFYCLYFVLLHLIVYIILCYLKFLNNMTTYRDM
jgi:hypothetical protein